MKPSIEELKMSPMANHCVRMIEEAMVDPTLGKMEQIMFWVCQLHAHYTREYRKNLEETQRSLISLWTDHIQKQRGTYSNPKQQGVKYSVVVIHIAAAALPFVNGGAYAASAQGVSGIGSAIGAAGGTYDEKQAGERMVLQHEADMMRRLVDQNNQSSNKGSESTAEIYRLAMEVLRNLHQAITQMIRGG